MNIHWRRVVLVLAPAVVLALWALGVTAFIAATLDAAARRQWLAALDPLAAPLMLTWVVVSAVLGALVNREWRRRVASEARLTRERLQSQSEREREVRAAALDAARDIEQERSRLAALMSELTQSVVVCNLDGRVLLYNQRARVQFRALSDAPATVGGAELIGLGRSIYAALDRKLIAHALESIRERLQRGTAQASAQFVTGTRGGQLLRVQMAPVLGPGESDAPDVRPPAPPAPPSSPSPEGIAPSGNAPSAREINGFVLMLDNITRDFAEESQRDRLLHALAEGSRASLGNLQAALEMLDFPDLDASTRERFFGVIRDEAQRMAARLNELAAHNSALQKTRWPLEDMLGADLVAAAQRRIEAQHACRVTGSEVDAALWLRVDSYSLLQALLHLAGRLVGEYDVRHLQLRLAVHGPRAQLDLLWIGRAMSTETVVAWETEPMVAGGESLALTLRDVVDRHGGEFWFERERVRQAAFFRFLLPLADARTEADSELYVRRDSRPETYDFDLFKLSEPAREWEQRRLVDLTYTVFDTETTGLDPAGGDEIIQIGAARIVNGKLRRQECFEQLVDPQRPIPRASIPIHGITPEMVRGQPTIGRVLPAFHAYAQDSVLVAHNAAFDMRFLQLKEAATGVVFQQPVLDTLLLSVVVHPDQELHSLEAIAERLDVPLVGRHTALGDALVTAEVFVKLLALLAAMDIHTLGQAREAAQKTYYARLQY